MTLVGESRVVVEETLVFQMEGQGSQIATLEILAVMQVFGEVDRCSYFHGWAFFVRPNWVQGSLLYLDAFLSVVSAVL